MKYKLKSAFYCAMMAASLATLTLLLSCQTGMEQLIEAKELNALSPDGRIQTLPRLTEHRDSAVAILLPDTVLKYQQPTNTFTLADTILFPTYPHDLLGDCQPLPLGSVPDFQISQIELIDSDDDKFFLLAWNGLTRNKVHREGERACLIFNKKGKCLAKVTPTLTFPNGTKVVRDVQDMAINRKKKEIRLECMSERADFRYACYYNYKGKYLRRELLVPNNMRIDSFCDDWITAMYKEDNTLPAFDLPQLLLYNERLKEFRRALLEPQKIDARSKFVSSLASAPNGDLFYAPYHSDTVWQVTPDAVIARYVLHGPTVGATVSPYDKDSTYVPGTYFLSQNGRMCRSDISNFLVSDDFMFLQYCKWNTLEWDNKTHSRSGSYAPIVCILSRRTNHVRMFQAAPIWPASFSSQFLVGKPRCLTANNELVYVEDIVSLKKKAATYKDTNILSNSEKDFIKRLPMDGNPVLILLPLKHF